MCEGWAWGSKGQGKERNEDGKSSMREKTHHRQILGKLGGLAVKDLRCNTWGEGKKRQEQTVHRAYWVFD